MVETPQASLQSALLDTHAVARFSEPRLMNYAAEQAAEALKGLTLGQFQWRPLILSWLWVKTKRSPVVHIIHSWDLWVGTTHSH